MGLLQEMAECLNLDDSLNKLGLPPKTGIIFENLYLMETPGPPVMCERQSTVLVSFCVPVTKHPGSQLTRKKDLL